MAVVLWADLGRALPSTMALKETVVVVPRAHARRRYDRVRQPRARR
jgi:hypothetical protein